MASEMEGTSLFCLARLAVELLVLTTDGEDEPLTLPEVEEEHCSVLASESYERQARKDKAVGVIEGETRGLARRVGQG